MARTNRNRAPRTGAGDGSGAGTLSHATYETAVNGIGTWLRKLPRNCWNAALEAAEARIQSAGQTTATIGNAARRTRTATTAATAPLATRTTRRRRRATTTPQTLTAPETKVLAAMPTSGFVNQSAITIPGMRPNNIGRSLGTLAKKGYVTGTKGGSWRRTAESMAAA